jgi:hypothetical protein
VRLAAELNRKKVRPRIQADDELRTLVLDRLGEPVGEGRRRHSRHALTVLTSKDGEVSGLTTSRQTQNNVEQDEGRGLNYRGLREPKRRWVVSPLRS